MHNAMKRFLQLCLTMAVVMSCFSCANASNNTTEEGTNSPTESKATSAFEKKIGVNLPEYMLPGPIDPVWGENEIMVVAMAHIGPFSSLEELKKSPFFPIWNSCYPGLDKIKDIIDTGKGDLWYIRPLGENCSLAINEYNMDMFTGKQEEGSGKVYYRTESATPLLLRMDANDPGSVQINVVDNDGHSFGWIPTMAPADNVLRDATAVTDVTYHPIDWLVDFGADYLCDLGNKKATLRFYGDGQVSINGRLGRYVSFHPQKDQSGIALYYVDEQGREGTAILTKFEQSDDGFNFQRLDGYGLGVDDFVTFLKQ